MFKRTVSSWVRRLKEGITPSMIFFIIIGSAICTFGVHNIHQQTHITEGGLIGTMLLIEHWDGAAAFRHHPHPGYFRISSSL